MTSRPVRILRRGLLSQLLLLTVLVACDPDAGGRIDDPRATDVLTGGLQRALAGGIQWSASAGSISTAGLFTAPAEAGTYRVQATYGGVTGAATVNVVTGTPPTGAPPRSAPPKDHYNYASSTCGNMPLRTTGRVYYFCDCQAGAQTGCVAGNDANNGLSPATPKRRWYTATQTFNAMNAGDTVALCKGGAWNLDVATGTCGSADPGATRDSGSAYLQNPRCAAGADLADPRNTSTCDIRDYQASWGGSNKPLLAIPASVTSPTMILGRNGTSTAGVRVMNLEFRGNGRGPGGGTYTDTTGIYWGSCGATTDTSWLVCNNTFSNLAVGLHMEENGATANYVRIWGNRILMSWLDGILSGPGRYSKFDANFFDNNGGWGSPRGPAHAIYPNGKNGSPGAEIINNEIRYSTVTSVNAIISGHGQWDGLNVENNLIDCGARPVAGCWAMKLDSGNRSGAGPHYVRNARVHRNTIYASSAGIGLGQAPGAVVENNVVVMVGGTTDWKRGVLIPSEPNFGWDLTG
ncbi:MAG TPA: hypothetical protein VEA99_10750, partial [Gemmatimonadaceae bacterium]|nr:hypothetical protein [Gemmatimonadaceae bacterium]